MDPRREVVGGGETRILGSGKPGPIEAALNRPCLAWSKVRLQPGSRLVGPLGRSTPGRGSRVVAFRDLRAQDGSVDDLLDGCDSGRANGRL